MKVFVTGVCGQVGSHVAEMLLERGDTVVGIDNFATGRPEHLPRDPKLTFVEDTIADRDLINQLIGDSKPDVVVHTAASYKDPEDWFNDATTNVVGGANLVRASLANKVGRFIYFQTALCYGTKPLQNPIRLDHPKFPANSSYAISKTAAEDYLEISGQDYVTFRLANVVGPRNVSGPLPIFFQRLSEGKRCFVTTARRDFVFVKDLARVVLKAVDGAGRGAYHFSSGSDVAIKELYDAVVAAVGVSEYPQPEIRQLGPDDAPSILLDPSRTFADFGKVDFTPLSGTVAAAVEYYRRYGVKGGYTHLKLDDKKEVGAKVRILITGGAGCLGSNLVERYIPAGHEVLVIDNFATGKREVLPLVRGLRVVEGTIADPLLVDQCFDEFKPTHVIHSAAAYKDPNDWVEDVATNVTGTIHVAKAAAKHGVKRFINFQTALCYGRPKQVPIPVDHPQAPFTSYGISKTAGEQYLLNSGLPVISLRLANITGPRLAIGPIPTFYKRLKATQKCFCSDTVRDFLDMEDFFSVMEIAMRDDAPTGVFNVSTGEGHTIKDVFDTVVEYLGVTLQQPVPIVPPGADDVSTVVLDPALTIKELGWRGKIGFSETINRMLRWYDAHGVTDVYSHLSAPNQTSQR